MYDLLGIVTGIALALGLLVVVAKLLERRARSQGPLFTGPPTAIGRVIAILLALIFAGAFLTELQFADRFHILFPILAVALFAYALGAHRFLARIQGGSDDARDKDDRK